MKGLNKKTDNDVQQPKTKSSKIYSFLRAHLIDFTNVGLRIKIIQ